MASFAEIRAKMKEKYGDQYKTDTASVSSQLPDETEKPMQSGQTYPSASSARSFESIRSEMKKKYSDPYVDAVYIDLFRQDASRYLSSMQSDYEIMNENNASSVYQERKQTADDLRKRSSAVRMYLENNKDSLDPNAYQDFTAFLDEFDKVSSQSTYEFYKGAEYLRRPAMSTDELKLAQGTADGNTIAYTDATGRNYTWNALQHNASQKEDVEAKEAELRKNDDWYDKSQNTFPFDNSALISDYSIMHELLLTYYPRQWEYAEIDGITRHEWENWQAKRKYIEDKYNVNLTDAGYDDRDILSNLMQQLWDSGEAKTERFTYLDQMTYDEKAVLYYIFNTQGRDAAMDWYNQYEDIYQDRFNASVKQGVEEVGKQMPVFASAMSLVTNLASPVEYVLDLIDYGTGGERPYNTLANITSAARGSVAENHIDWEIGGYQIGDMLYNTTMSGLDSVLASPVGGFMLGMSAAAQATNEAYDRGLDDSHAILTGLASGAAEMIFESISLGKLKSMKEIASPQGKEILKNLVKTMAVNGSEEFATEVANIATDFVINDLISDDDFSAYATSVRMYQECGYTLEEAKSKALGDLGVRVAEAAGSGTLMGLGFGSFGQIGAIGMNVRNSQRDTAIAKGLSVSDSGMQKLKDLAMEVATERSDRAAKKINEQIGKVNSNPSVRNTKSLYRSVSDSYASQIKNDTIKSLKRKGFSSKDAVALGTALTAEATGGIIGAEESGILRKYQSDSRLLETRRNLLENAKSTVGQRMENLSGLRKDAVQGLTTSQIAGDLDTEGYGQEADYDFNDSDFQAFEFEYLRETARNLVEERRANLSDDSYASWIKRFEEADEKQDAALYNQYAAQLSGELSIDRNKIYNMYLDQQQTGVNSADSLPHSEAVARSAGAVAAPISAALETFRTTGAVTNQDALRILNNQEAVSQLVQQTGMKLPDTASGKRAAVKTAVAQLAQHQENTTGMANRNEADTGTKAHDSGTKASDTGTTTTRDSKSSDDSGKVTKRRPHRRGSVKSWGMTMELMQKSFNPAQKKAYNILRTIANVTGIDIVLFRSKADADGNFRGGIVNGINMDDAQGAFSWHDGKIYVDVNAGLTNQSQVNDLAMYSMLRTFTHEFVHFIEQHNAAEYEAFRDLVFEEMREKGTDPEDLIDAYIMQHPEATEDEASREVVAESMTDILPQTQFIKKLAEQEPGLFKKLLERLKAFIQDIKDHFAHMGSTASAEVAAVKKDIDGVIRYTEKIVAAFDRVAVGAVENYQKSTPAQKNTAEGGVQYQARRLSEDDLEQNPTSDPDIRYQRRTATLSNREILEQAARSVGHQKLTTDQRAALDEFKGHLAQLQKLEDRKAREEKIIQEAREKGAKQTEYQDAINRRNVLSSKIRHETETLLKLENTNVLRRVLQKAKGVIVDEQTAERNRALADYRTKTAESRKRTELRNKIRRVVKDISKLYSKGKGPNNVKEEMKEFVYHAVSSAELLLDDLYTDDDMIRNGLGINLGRKANNLLDRAKKILYRLDNPPTANSVAQLEEWNRREEKLKRNLSEIKAKLREEFLRERQYRKGDVLSMVMRDLRDSYELLSTSKEPHIRSAFSPFVLMHIDGVRENLKSTRVEDMTLEELTEVHDAYTMVLESIRKSNKAFGINGSIDHLAKQLINDFGGDMVEADQGAIKNFARNASNAVGWNYEKLYYALERIGSPTFTQLFTNLANAENIIMEDVAHAKKHLLEAVNKYGFNKWKVNKKVDRVFVDNLGHSFKMTLGEVMLLYAYTRRGNVWKQLEIGGFTLGSKSLFDARNATAYKLTPEQCISITNTLTQEQKHFVEDMQKYLSEVMGEKGNEVSMKLYGVKLYNDPNYCPIHIAGEYKARAEEAKARKEAGFESLSNAGFTKAKNPDAKATIVLESFMDIWADHVNEMSRYHGAVPALEDIRRVMNYSENSDGSKDSKSVQAMLKNRFGKQAVAYFSDLYREVNSGAVMDKLQAVPKKLLSKSRKAAVFYKLSVLIQQPSSICRAFAMVDKKYFSGPGGVGALPIGVYKTVTNRWTKAQSRAYEEMVKYAPGVTLAKEIGGFDAFGGGIRNYLLDTEKGLLDGLKTGTVGEKLQAAGKLIDDNPIANLPNLADKIAWIEIWNACKRETKDKHRSMDVNSDAFMKLVGRRFTDVIRATQVYDSVFAKSPWLKSKNTAVQYLVSYMNEPNVTANMVESAIRDIRKGGGENIRRGAKKLFAVSRSIIFCAVLKSLIHAMHDDDEDETFIEKYTTEVISNAIDDITLFNYFPIVRDIWSACKGYDVERPDMSLFSDLIFSVKKYYQVKNNDISDMSPEELEEWDSQCTEVDWGLVGSIANCFGIPVKNVYKEIDSVFNIIQTSGENAGKTTWKNFEDACYQGVVDALPFHDQESKSDKIYDALMSEDTEYLERLQTGYLNSDGELKTSYYTALRKGLREHDPRIQEAANARKGMDTDGYQSIIDDIVAEGHFSKEDVVAAIRTEYNKLKDEDSAKLLFEALASGDQKTAEKLKSNFVNDKGEFSESSYQSAIRKGLREHDPRILQAAEAKLNKDFTLMNNICNQIAAEGHFDWSDIRAAITAEYNELTED